MARLASRSLFSRSVLGRLPTILRYPFTQVEHAMLDADVISAELLAIAVDPQVRGGGIGSRLVEAFEEGLSSWGVRGRYRVATNVEEDVSKRFYERAGFVPGYQTSHNAPALQAYFKRLPERP